MMRDWIIACLVTFGLAATVADCAAEKSNIANESFNSAAIPLERARLQTRLRTAVAAFDAQLAAQSAAERDEWHAYLNWNAWATLPLHVEASNANASNDVVWNLDAMKRIASRFYTAEEGFENPRIVELRTALADYLAFEEALNESPGDPTTEFLRRSAQLQQVSANASFDYAEIESAAWWLAATRQAPAALAQVRAAHNQPAIVLQVHRDLIEAKLDQFEQESRQQRNSRHHIQGATVVGTSHVASHTAAQLRESPDEARLRIVTTGRIHAPHNVASSGRVQVASSSTGRFTVSADLFWNGERLVATAPQASASVNSTIKRIDAPRLLRRAAARRVSSSRAGAEEEGATLIEQQAVHDMGARLETAVERLNRKAEGFLNLLTRTGNKAARWTTRVRADSVHIGYTPPSVAGLGARPHELPPLVGDETLGLSIHDSGVEGVVRPLLAGKTWTDANFSMLQRELTGANSEELMIGLEPGRWSAQWSWRHPVRIHFTPEKAMVRYRFARSEIDGAAYDAPFEVRADLRVVANPLGLQMYLLQPATVVSLDPQRPLPPHFQSFLEHKFRGLFGESFCLDGLQFPAGGALDGMSAFRVASATLDSNWVHLRYTNRKPQSKLVSREGDELTQR
jgi:hypothetical protein